MLLPNWGMHAPVHPFRDFLQLSDVVPCVAMALLMLPWFAHHMRRLPPATPKEAPGNPDIEPSAQKER
jgi:hypothetical protein